MSKGYNEETVILPDSLDKAQDTGNKFFLFAFYDGKIEKYRLEGVKHLGRRTDDSIPDIAVQNKYLSRSHGFFEVTGGNIRYTAEETTNGIALNGNVIKPATTVDLADGDELTISTGNNIVMKCAFSSSRISLLDSMIQAQYDELTGLPGRRLFTDRFITLPRSDSNDDWLFILDVDRFKQINDTYGHSIGDDTLKALAEELKKKEHHIRLSARWGGDEFVGVISGSKEDAQLVLDGLVSALSSKMIRGIFNIFVSVGSCRIPKISDSEQLSSTLEKADKALYRAKKDDNERICFFE